MNIIKGSTAMFSSGQTLDFVELYKQLGNKCSVSQLIIKLLWGCFCVMAPGISVSSKADNFDRSSSLTAYMKLEIEN